MRCALFFGSFNPIHFGHINIAKYLIMNENVDQVRLVISPHNPCKDISLLESAQERLIQAKEEISRIELPPHIDGRIVVSDVEFSLPEPRYTINTLRHLQKEEKRNEFILVIGGDNIRIIQRWHLWRELLQEFEVWVYPRIGVDSSLEDDLKLCEQYNSYSNNPNTLPNALKAKGVRYLKDAPLYNISSTEIRGRK